MNHIDEGTIHAWLDGALSAEQSRAVETHVAQCATCSASVAEARGLIAGASRILISLDDVPANVTPKRAPAPPVVRRQWRAARWVTGIAAALMIGVGVTQWDRVRETTLRRDVESATAPLADRAADSIQATAPPPALVEARAEPAASSRAQTSGATRSGATRSVATEQGATPRTPRTATAGQERQAFVTRTAPLPAGADLARRNVGGGAGATEMKRDMAAAPRGEVAIALSKGEAAGAPSVSAPPPTPGDTARINRLRRLESQNLQLSEVVVTGARESSRGGAEGVRLRGGSLDEPAQVAEMAGCYSLRTAAEQRSRLDEAKRAVGAVAGAAAAAPSREQAQARFLSPAAPAAIRLDTVRTPFGFAVREQYSDSTIGAWRRVAGDSARVDLFERGLFTFARAARVGCPER